LQETPRPSTLVGVAFDDELAERVRERLAGTDGVTELKMFGGWGVTIHGNMAVGVMEEDLIVRVGPDAYDTALKRPGVRPFDFTGREMTGWVFVDGERVANTRTLTRWIDQGVAFAQSLPRKKNRSTRRPPARR
jgi:TfoX/Sxy family transcriptional regulator of competence genes